MSGQYPDRIRQLPLFDGRFDAYKLEAKGADVLFASYAADTSIPAHTHDTDNYGVITRGELILTQNGMTTRHGERFTRQKSPIIAHNAGGNSRLRGIDGEEFHEIRAARPTALPAGSA
jgi:hypothetical protein